MLSLSFTANPKQRDSQNRVSDTISAFKTYLENADDTTRKFLNISERRRDDLLGMDFEYQYLAEVPLAIDYYTNPGKPTIYYSDDLNCMSDKLLDKIATHELGHMIPQNAAYGTLMKADIPLQIAKKWISTTTVLTGSLLGYFNGEFGGMMLGTLLGRAAVPLTGIAVNFPSRMAEMNADLFSDKMVPEVGYKDVYAWILETSPWVKGEEYLVKNPLVALPFHACLEHPSNYTRINRSERNCEILLEEKKRLGIPSFIPA